LLEEMSGDNTDGSTNIVPRMDPQALKTGYKRILDEIYSPRLFYERVLNFLKVYNPNARARPIELQEVLALFRSILFIGILGPERREYWKLFFWALFHEPQKFPMAITMSIYGFHFRKVSELGEGA